MDHQINVFKDNEAVAEAFAMHLAERLQNTGLVRMAVSGGSTPKVLFQNLAERYADTIKWQNIHLFWVDERCVPPHDTDSNYGMTFEKLLSHIDIPSRNIHRIWGENEPDKEAAQYGAIVSGLVPSQGGVPIFDLILLGMGGDGHTASIFPAESHLLNSKAPYAVATHPETGQKRISMTGKIINAAKDIHFLVTGSSKAPVVQEIFGQSGNYRSYPASHIQGATWWLDKAAYADAAS